MARMMRSFLQKISKRRELKSCYVYDKSCVCVLKMTSELMWFQLGLFEYTLFAKNVFGYFDIRFDFS